MTADFHAGDVLLGKYRVDGIVGQGGMGFIVRAQHLQLGERVALKFLRREILENPEAVGRFMREARAAIRIKSEHVARVIDVNTLETGEPFIVMEYLEGEALSVWAQRHGRLPIESVVEFTLQICEAIAEAHGLGIVHRDLKPANVFVTKRADGIFAAKVLDFGISKVSDPRSTNASAGVITKDVAMGSPAYCSPEQLQTPQEVDQRADLWSLGVMLYELLTGRLPFEAENTLQLCVKVIHEDVPPVGAACPQLPEGLRNAVERCLQKSPNLRFQNVAELAHALAPYAPARARPSVERIIRTVAAANGVVPAEIAAARTEEIASPHVLDRSLSRLESKRRSRAPLIIAGVALSAMLASGVSFVSMRSGSEPIQTGPQVFVIQAESTTSDAKSAASLPHASLVGSKVPQLAIPLRATAEPETMPAPQPVAQRQPRVSSFNPPRTRAAEPKAESPKAKSAPQSNDPTSTVFTERK